MGADGAGVSIHGARFGGIAVRIVLPAYAVLLAAAAPPAAQFGETCTGTETVSLGDEPPRTAAYALTFSADLGAARYCYDACSPGQSFAIADAASAPVKLADLDRGGQSRHILFDRAAQTLTDDQVFDAGFGLVTRHARASCQEAPFTRPAR